MKSPLRSDCQIGLLDCLPYSLFSFFFCLCDVTFVDMPCWQDEYSKMLTLEMLEIQSALWFLVNIFYVLLAFTARRMLSLKPWALAYSMCMCVFLSVVLDAFPCLCKWQSSSVKNLLFVLPLKLRSIMHSTAPGKKKESNEKITCKLLGERFSARQLKDEMPSQAMWILSVIWLVYIHEWTSCYCDAWDASTDTPQ